MRLFAAIVLSLTLTVLAYAQLAPPNAAGVTYGHVHLNVKDIEVHKKLWVDHFGAVVVQKGTFIVAKLPGMAIAFREAPPAGSSEGTAMDRVGFKVRDLAATLKGWRAAGYQVTREFTGPEGFRNAYLLGPDNIKIELQEDKTLKVKASAHHLNFLVSEPVKLRDWYVNLFSAMPRKRGTIEITADVPGMNLSFERSETSTVGTKGRVIDHIGFEVDNLEAFVKQLDSKGIKIDVPYRQIPALGVSIAYLTDPSGVYIELTEGYAKF